ncbi:MAG: RIP metalloprotease RseP [Candidatus Mariimomonas ferrooxydans]
MTFFWAVILFGILIFFHELGHFIFAKLVGVKVLKFSLGFGPKLLGRKIGETDYVISAIPLGGYVKPLGEEPGEEIKEEDRPRAFNYQPVWKRTLIVLAGPVFNLVLAYVIFVVFLSMKLPVLIPDLERVTNTTIENVLEDSPAMKAGLKKGDKVVSISGKDITTWLEVNEKIWENPGKELNLRVSRDNELIEIRVVPEAEKIKDQEGKEIVIGNIGISKMSTTIADVLEDSPAMKAGFKTDDTIVSIDGEDIGTWLEMQEIISRSAGKELNLRVSRGNELIDIRVVPESKEIKDQDGKEVVLGRIGVSKKLDVLLIQSSGILDAPKKGLEAVYRWCVLTLQIVGKLFTGAVSAKQIGGPILIVDAAAKAASIGASTYFNFIAVISINLAILNLFPVPVLDGGHLVFLSIEALRGRPMSERITGVLTKAGFAMLMLLVAFVFYNDIMRVIVPWVQKMLNP